MLKIRTTYNLYGNIIQEDGSKTPIRTWGWAFPKVKNSAQVDDWVNSLSAQNKRPVEINLWYPVKTEIVWKDWVKTFSKRNQK